MEIIIHPDSKSACFYASSIITQLIQTKPNANLGLATGSTPLPLYQELVRRHGAKQLDLSQVQTFNLDEYLGLSPAHPASYHSFMQEHFFSKVNIPTSHIHIPDGLAANIPAHCLDYEAQIKNLGGIDLQILGIGGDGHIGFNEPSSSLQSRTRVKTLLPQTRDDNKHFFKPDEQVPHHVLTMGIGTIMEAKTILLLAFGEKKAEAIARSIEGPLTARVPASILQMHPRTIVLLDEAAASKLELKEYYRYVFQNKCDWQKIKTG